MKNETDTVLDLIMKGGGARTLSEDVSTPYPEHVHKVRTGNKRQRWKVYGTSGTSRRPGLPGIGAVDLRKREMWIPEDPNDPTAARVRAHEMAHVALTPYERDELEDAFREETLHPSLYNGAEDCRIHHAMRKDPHLRSLLDTPFDTDAVNRSQMVAQNLSAMAALPESLRQLAGTDLALAAYGTPEQDWTMDFVQESYILSDERMEDIARLARKIRGMTHDRMVSELFDYTERLRNQSEQERQPQGRPEPGDGNPGDTDGDQPTEGSDGDESVDSESLTQPGSWAADPNKRREVRHSERIAEHRKKRFRSEIDTRMTTPPRRKPRAIPPETSGEHRPGQRGYRLPLTLKEARGWARARDERVSEWCEMEISEPPLMRKLKKQASEPKVRRPKEYGRAGRNINRLWKDGKALTVTRRRPRNRRAGTVLIDMSGSMNLTNEELTRIVELVPGAVIAGYNTLGGHTGTLHILARRGRMVDLDRIHTGGGNGVDGPALEWLGKQAKPRIWVSDGLVTGCGDGCTTNLVDDAERIMREHGILRIPDVDQLLSTGYTHLILEDEKGRRVRR